MWEVRNEAQEAPAVPGEGYARCRAPQGCARRSVGADGLHGVGAGNGVKDIQHLRTSQTARTSHGLADCETPPMGKPPTGEPYAGKPPVRFGGRGGLAFPTPIEASLEG
jgi:hypothetical protein